MMSCSSTRVVTRFSFFKAIGGLTRRQLCDTLQAMASTNVKTVHQTSLLHIESNFDRLGLLLPIYGQRFSAVKGTHAPNSFHQQAQFFHGHTSCRNKKIRIPRSMAVEALSWLSRRARQHPAVQSPMHPSKTPQKTCPFAALCWPSQGENRPWLEISFSLRNLRVRAFDSRAQAFSTFLARRRSSSPPP